MDTTPLAPLSPAEKIEWLKNEINELETTIRDAEVAKMVGFTHRHEITPRERKILTIGYEVAISKDYRNLAKMKSKLETLNLAFLKRTFWHSL